MSDGEKNDVKGASSMESAVIRNVGRKGLVNLGNTCYMNAFLQALYQIKDYREALLAMDDLDFLQTKQEDGTFKGPQAAQKVKLSLY